MADAFDPFEGPWRGPRRRELIARFLQSATTAEHHEGEEEDDDGVQSSVVALTFMAPASEQWSFIIELIEAAPDRESVLGAIAAGPLEGLLGRFGEVAIGWVEERARFDPKLHRVLTGVWQHRMTDSVWARVQALQRREPSS
jgi:hypothetical protein